MSTSTRTEFTGLDPFNLATVELTRDKLGSGSYASVYVVNYLGLKCAGKKIHDVLLEQGGGATYALSRFEDECRILSQLRHPHIVQFLGVFFEDRTSVPILVLEFLPTNLTSCVEKYGALRQELGYSILHDVALGLNYLHSHTPCIVHRDLSANNVLLTSDMKAKISDLGVAKILNLTPLQVSKVVHNTQAPGTAAYMPPEALIANPTYDASIDIFSFGVMMIHVFSGQWPEPQGVSIQIKRGKMIPVSEAERRDVFLEAIGKKHPLMKLIRRCIDNDSKRRPTANDIVPLLSKEKSPLFTNVQDLLEQIEETRKQLSKAQVRVEELQDELRKAKANPGIGASQKRASHSSGASPHQQHGYGGSQHGGEYRDLALPQGGSAMAAAPRPTISYSFSMGSTIQLHSDPPRYGVIQWIGNLPEIHGQIAGVELEESMDGCGDGLWSGVRYFSCRQGHAFFCPLSSLSPDQRFAQTTTAGGVNPLDYVPFEEEEDQFVDPGQIDLIDKYIGEAKGIQGHQNSCYLDSTVFGLFALSEVFDSLFLDQKAGDPAGDEVKRILWKGIVNPLRKNAVVRYESVMRLRNKLEELGKMKGVNQDEKDPERFLNMLFKHTLHVTPFIRIKRPFGVEHEYFVQLFVEHDKSLQLPTVGDLLKRMFIEQKTRFTKVPSKLLIQIPRYEGGFKTYQKLIPGLKLKVKRLVCSTNRCFICGDTAWNKCHECSNDFLTIDVVYFCENCSDRTHGKTTTRTKHEVTEVTPDPGGINELDLLSVICIETSHYICFTRSEERWVFFDSMASRVDDMYNIPKVVDCTDVLNEWVYPVNGDLTRLLNTPPRELPEYVRRFTQDIYLCVYIQPDFAMYGDVEEDVV